MDFKHIKELLKQYQNGSKIDFSVVNELAMAEIEDVLNHFVPDGELQGREYVAYNPTRDDGELGSFKFNIETGKWADFATDDVGGDIVSYVKYTQELETQSEAAIEILKFLASSDCHSTGAASESPLKQGRHAQPRAEDAEGPLIVMPIPEGAMRTRPEFFFRLGRPTAVWEYRDEQGRPLFYQQRFDTAKGKVFQPLSCWKDAGGRIAWRSQLPPAPRPPYGLDRLAARPNAPVLFAEGEKTADAAQRLFPDFVVVTTLNGANSPAKTDFRYFRGRYVYIAPDNDLAGRKYAAQIADLLESVGAVVKGVLRVELLRRGGAQLQPGYDLADAEAEGWTAEELARLGEELWETLDSRDGALPDQHDDLHARSDEGCSSAGVLASEPKPSARSQRREKKSLSLQVAQAFAQNHFDGYLLYANNQFRAYERGCWAELDLTVDVKRRLMVDLGDDASTARINEATELLKICHARKETVFDSAPSLICLNNGTLDPKTGRLLPHSPDHYLFNRLDIDYEPDARCPIWERTLEEIFQPDEDRLQRIQFLQEFAGYCLIPDTSQGKFLWMIGSGGNGKSLLLSTIASLVGQHNVSYAAIERLEDPNVRAELQGKLVNISAEMSAKATVSDGYLKQLVTGESIEAERKFEKPFFFKPFARLIGATNALPRLLDQSDGFARRAVILRLNRQFSEAEQDRGLEAKLKKELPGILNWALAGLRRLLERGHFIIPPSSMKEVQTYRVNSDPVRQFAELFLSKAEKDEDWSGGQWLYEQYRDWARDNGYQPCANNQFSDRLGALGFEKVKTRKGRFWKAHYSELKQWEGSAEAQGSQISNLAVQFQV